MLGEELAEAVEAPLPLRAPLADPALGGTQGPRLDLARPHPADLVRAHHAAAFQHVQLGRSGKEANGRVTLIFNRYGKEYFLATVSDGTSSSTYDCPESNEEKRLADAGPKSQLKLVTVLSTGSPSGPGFGRK